MKETGIDTSIESLQKGFDLRGRFISEGESTILPPLTFRDRVARRAYFLYLEQPERQGHDLEDWLLAEQQIRAESGPRPPQLRLAQPNLI